MAELVEQTASKSRRWRGAWIALGAAVCLASYWTYWTWLASDMTLLRQAELASQRNQHARAEALAARVLQRQPSNRQALAIAVQSARHDNRFDIALGHLLRVPESSGPLPVNLLKVKADLEFQLNRLAEMEVSLRKVLVYEPRERDSLQTLVHFLRIEGRNWEVQELARGLMNAQGDSDELYYVLGTTDWIWVDARESQNLATILAQNPDDPLPVLGDVRRQLLNGETNLIADKLLQLAGKHPEISEVQAALGTLHWLRKDDVAFLAWQSALPATAESHPEIWNLRGMWLRKHGEDKAATRCFAEAICRHPNHRGACYQLSQLLRSAGNSELAEQLGQRAVKLSQVETLLKEVQHTPSMMRELAELLEALGRDWEAVGWARMANKREQGGEWADKLIMRLHSRLWPDPPEIRPLAPLTRGADKLCVAINREKSPLPDWSHFKSSSTGGQTQQTAPDRASPITFEDDAFKLGIEFRYDNGTEPASGRAYMFEFSGGGVAAFDYDGDGWCDVQLTQGGRWKQAAMKPETDRLFRNLGENRFQEVATLAHLDEPNFSQGVTVGDYDNDGFQDVYIANIGPNSFYHNNGDGTFSLVTDQTGTAGDAWSLSAALADLNADGLPDLYVVNYLGGDDVFQRVCLNGLNGNRPIQCFPTSFPAAQDRLYLNQGDGSFRDITADSGIQIPDGKGMGIVVADLNDDRVPDIFIANDTTPNFLFRGTPGAPGRVPRFLEEGVLAGVAVDDRGLAQSSMGVAVGDVNVDGRLDLFVTNYILEASNLFIQHPDHSFIDQIRDSGLRESSVKLLKWGAQFLDADLDGDLDLIIANGHLDDYSFRGVPYRMPTQVYANDGQGHFTEITADQLGPYFTRLNLGRSIARWDWNRDGRHDAIVTHVDAPVAVLTNTTATSGHALRLQLRGISSNRDAVGATIHMTSNEHDSVHQLATGDGFEAANERTLIMGLGKSPKADRVRIQWPDGHTQDLNNLAADKTWLIRQGQPAIELF